MALESQGVKTAAQQHVARLRFYFEIHNRMLSGNSRCLHGAPSSRRIRGSVFCLRPERSSVSKRFTCPELRSGRAGGFYESATESFYSRTAKQRHDSPWEVNIWLFQDSIVGVFHGFGCGQWSVIGVWPLLPTCWIELLFLFSSIVWATKRRNTEQSNVFICQHEKPRLHVRDTPFWFQRA